MLDKLSRGTGRLRGDEFVATNVTASKVPSLKPDFNVIGIRFLLLSLREC